MVIVSSCAGGGGDVRRSISASSGFPCERRTLAGVWTLECFQVSQRDLEGAGEEGIGRVRGGWIDATNERRRVSDGLMIEEREREREKGDACHRSYSGTIQISTMPR